MQKENENIRIWTEDKLAIIQTMAENALSDLANANYDPTGGTVIKSVCDLGEYVKEFVRAHGTLCGQPEEDAEAWCHIDMLMRGVISE